MKYKVLPRRVTLLVYPEFDNVNYTASCQININGVHGTIDSLSGKDFYKFLLIHGYKPFKDLGLVEVSASISPAHLRLLKTKLKDTIKILELGEPEEVAPGIKLCWIKMTEAEKSPSS